MDTKTTESTRQTLDLPETPEGYTRKMLMHLSFEDGGAGTYSVHDANGERMPFGYQYDSRKGGLSGFTVPGIEGVMTWAQLRKHFAPQAYEVKHVPSEDTEGGEA